MTQFVMNHPKNITCLLSSVQKLPECARVLKIQQCPSVQDACKLISHKCFREKINKTKISAVVISVNDFLKDKLCTDKFMQEATIDKSFIVSFESSIEEEQKIIYWKTSRTKDFMCIKLVSGFTQRLTDFVKKVLIEGVINEDLGTWIESRGKQLSITDIYDSNGNNLLFRAIKIGNLELIRELLTFPFDINEQNHEKKAIDLAYEEEDYPIIYELLQTNSMFPKNFYVDETPENIQKFIKNSTKIHQAIMENNFELVHKIIKNYPNLKYFFNLNNTSAPATALKFKRMEIYDLLTQNNIFLGPNEKIQDFIEDDEPKAKVRKLTKQIRSIHDKSAKTVDDKHLILLLANSYTSHDNQSSTDYKKIIQNAYEILNQNSLVRPILMVVAASVNFKIHFDFNRRSIIFIDPTSLPQENGTCYFMNGQIYIAAKELLYPQMKFEALGVIAHELFHYALYLVFRNGCKPYAVDDQKSSDFMLELLKKYKVTRYRCKLIADVYKYEPEFHVAELAVRAPQILIHYSKNPEKLEEFVETFPELFMIFEENILPILMESLEMISLLALEKILWNRLTEPSRSKVLDAKVKFQGFELKVKELISLKSFEVLRYLQPNQICKLLNDQLLEIELPTTHSPPFYIERTFKTKESKAEKNLNDLIAESMVHHVTLLSDQAGSGKTTTFKNISISLKEKGFKNHWISYIDLKRHVGTYKKYSKQEWNLESIFGIFVEILSIKEELEVQIFMHLFRSDKVILFWDGVDEISPNFKNFIVNLMLKIREVSLNCQWISTRPHHAEFLEVVFQRTAYHFLDYDEKDKLYFTKELLKNRQEISKSTENIMNLIKSLENAIHKINNPLLLQLIAEIYLSGQQVDLNLFKIYEQILNEKLKILSTKGEISNNDRDVRSKLNVWQVHQIYALKLIFRTGFVDPTSQISEFIDLGNFSIMKKWKRLQQKWTPEIISRYGLLIVDNWMSIDKWGISWEFPDFVHRTFAEFFVAQFLIENVYEEDDEEVTEAEIEMRLKLLYSIFFNSDYGQIRKFLSSFIDTQVNNGHKEFSELIHRITSKKEANKIFASKFFIQNESILNCLWQLDVPASNSLFMDLLNDNSVNFKYILDVIAVAEQTFPQDWLKITGFGSLYKIVEVDTSGYRANQRNFIILLHFMAENFPKSIEFCFLQKNFGEMFFNNFMDCSMFQVVFRRITSLAGDEKHTITQTVIDVIKNPYNFPIYQDESLVELMWKEIGEILNPKEMKKVLLHEYQSFEHPLLTAFRVKSMNIMEFYLKLYKKFCSFAELRMIFLTENKEFFWLQISSITSDKICHFEKFLSEIFLETFDQKDSLKLFFTQRDQNGQTLLSYMEEKTKGSLKNSEDSFKFEVLRKLASSVLQLS